MTQLHSELSDVFCHNANVVAVARPRNQDVTYQALGGMIANVQSLIATRAPKAVGILGTRSLEAYVAVMACFFSGVRFVPLNPELPNERLDKIIRYGQVDLLLHDGKRNDIDSFASGFSSDIAEVAAGEDTSDKPVLSKKLQASDIAYQMFTSGSTGEPKGVPITYGSLSHYVSGIRATTGHDTGGRFSQLFDLSFDLSMHDIFVALASGGTLVPASNIDLMMPHSYIQKKCIDYWFSVPLVASVALRGLGDNPVKHKLKKAMFCGEQLPTEYATGFRAFVEPDGPIYNLYGPTEATIAFTAKHFKDADPDLAVVPLGEPFGENVIGIRTHEGEVVEADEGAEGELLLGGPQVFSGYYPDNSVECFVGEDPRYYCSGDLVRVKNGELHHIGRIDSQIKLRGYRIELGDIEAAFRKAFGCAAAAAVVLGTGESREIVLAYEHTKNIDDFSLLDAHLPAYMRPAQFMRFEKIPTNINGKVDRKTIGKMQWAL